MLNSFLILATNSFVKGEEEAENTWVRELPLSGRVSLSQRRLAWAVSLT